MYFQTRKAIHLLFHRKLEEFKLLDRFLPNSNYYTFGR